MQKIDTSKWGAFVIENLMDRLDLKIRKVDFDKRIDTSLVQDDEFSLPLINAKDGNNGIMYYGREADFESAEMCLGIVQNGAVATGNVYAQIQRTGVLWDAYLVKPKVDINKYVLLFLSRILQVCIKKKFNYDNKAIWDKVKLESIPLPQDNKGNPNWEYMEQYMKQLEKKISNDILLLNNLLNRGGNSTRRIIDTKAWKSFHLYDDELFTIDGGTKLDKVKMSNNNPSINFVGRANANNGVTDYIDVIEGLKPYEAGNLTVSLGGEYIGSCFIQEKPFYTSQNVNVLIPKHPMSIYCKRFISAMIFREGRLHYKAFVDELNRHMRTDFTIMLPITSTGTPDWDYMENYMQMIEKKAKTTLHYLLATG